MEEDKKLKHVCKFCSKSFPCGRSLGGHMRSHMTTNNNNNNSADQTRDHHQKLMIISKHKKLINVVSVNYDDANTESSNLEAAGINGGYILREKPKKTWRLAEDNNDNNSSDKVCKECGKGFQSWKALFGHMKCHSDKEKGCSNNNSLEDSQSDNETAAPSKGRRSRRITRNNLGTTANSSTLMSEIDEQEQEEVALSLMMLSRDVGSHWGGLNSVAESSDNNNSVFLEAKIQIKKASSICNMLEKQKEKKKKKKKEKKLEYSTTVDSKAFQSEFHASGVSKNGGFRLNERSQLDGQYLNSSKRKLEDHQFESEFCKDPHKRSKFECSTCNKIFHSYQALGGHRASHRKIKGCFASRVDQSSTTENSIETENSPDPSPNKLVKSSIGNIEIPIGSAVADSYDNKAEVLNYGVIKKISKGHECPICFKVFPSGQALGGHKRSHLISEAKENQAIVIQKPIPEIRNFLDLNLPAPDEEETSSVHMEFKPWWIGSSSHKHEALVGLI